MIDQINEHIAKVAAFDGKTQKEVEDFRIAYLGKKGLLNEFFAAFKEMYPLIPSSRSTKLQTGNQLWSTKCCVLVCSEPSA